jgi:hypothetical protein
MATYTDRTAEAGHDRQVRDAYGIALVLVLVSTLALIATDPGLGSVLAFTAGVLQVAALVVTLRVSGVRRRASIFVSVAACAAFAAAVVAIVSGGIPGRATGLVIWLVVTLLTIGSVVGRLLTYRKVNLQLVMGLLVIYIMTGVAFGLGYLLADSFGGPAFAQGPQGVSGSVYFSFVTLATLGYGDISPGSNPVRALSVAEAIIGQLYLVSVVSFAVGRLGTRRSSADAES